MPIFNTKEAAAAFARWQEMLTMDSRDYVSIPSLSAYLQNLRVERVERITAKAGGLVLKKNLFLGPASDDGRRERVVLMGVEGALRTDLCEYPAGFKLFVAKGEVCIRRHGASMLDGYRSGTLEALGNAGAVRCRIEVVKPFPFTVFMMQEFKGFRPLAS